MDKFYDKYLKYKSKYLNLKNNSFSLKGGLKEVSFRKLGGLILAITYKGTIQYYVRDNSIHSVGKSPIKASFIIIKNLNGRRIIRRRTKKLRK